MGVSIDRHVMLDRESGGKYRQTRKSGQGDWVYGTDRPVMLDRETGWMVSLDKKDGCTDRHGSLDKESGWKYRWTGRKEGKQSRRVVSQPPPPPSPPSHTPSDNIKIVQPLSSLHRCG